MGGVKRFIFLGPDGVGKSSICDELKSSFESDGDVFVFHFRPFFLPKIFSAKDAAVDGKKFYDGSAKPSGSLRSIIRLCYFSLDFWIADCYYLFWSSIKRKRVIILFDRHLLDVFIHPVRYGVFLPDWVVLLSFRLTISPSKIFYFTTDPRVILQRKNEASEVGILEQNSRFQALKRIYKQAIQLEADKSLEELAAEVILWIDNEKI